jgi:hypothetical protein
MVGPGVSIDPSGGGIENPRIWLQGLRESAHHTHKRKRMNEPRAADVLLNVVVVDLHCPLLRLSSREQLPDD